MTREALRLSAVDPTCDTPISGRVVLVLDDESVEIELAVPGGNVAFEATLPILQQLTNFIVDRATGVAEAAGRTISCRAGCGACCRQLVPISQAEARALVRLVAEMPEPRRSEVRRRFEAALEALDAVGLLAAIDSARESETVSGVGELGMRYFRQGIACPFLENESCSIHPDRPLICRQYLVTSPARNCEDPSAATIETVRLPVKPSQAWLLADCTDSQVAWMPLTYALTYDDQVPPQAPVRTAPDILRDVFSRFGEAGAVPDAAPQLNHTLPRNS